MIRSFPLLASPHEYLRHQLFRPGHNRLAAEEDAHKVQFQHVGFAGEPGRIVDVRTVLLEGVVAAGITWRSGIDRYLEEGAASAA
ncbi:MAG TPA: hypothetical protein VGT44_21555 [Ktedonobacteraceae bacterium]|nr:hypothetical protein [Ktedonobacteraceae bacterium]